jgi:hypothetical protein
MSRRAAMPLGLLALATALAAHAEGTWIDCPPTAGIAPIAPAPWTPSGSAAPMPFIAVEVLAANGGIVRTPSGLGGKTIRCRYGLNDVKYGWATAEIVRPVPEGMQCVAVANRYQAGVKCTPMSAAAKRTEAKAPPAAAPGSTHGGGGGGGGSGANLPAPIERRSVPPSAFGTR